MYSLPGNEDPIRKKLYRSFTSTPDRSRAAREGAKELDAKLKSFTYRGEPLPDDARRCRRTSR